jgi:hypothetical protein
MTAWLRIQHDNTQEGENYRKTITNRAMAHATRHSAITSSLTVLEALQRTLQELLGSIRWYGAMPIGYFVVWIMLALHDDREETVVNEESIQEGKNERKKNGRKEKANERKSTKERKGMRNCADAKRPEKSPTTTKSSNTTTRNAQPSKNNMTTSNALYTTGATSRRR